MDKVRPRDLEICDLDGKQWVRAGTGGMSTFQSRSLRPGSWWCIDKGYDHGSLLIVWNDHDQHWSWEPSQDMALADYKALLSATHASFYRV